MNRLYGKNQIRPDRRTGLIAMKEIALMIFILVAVLWLGSQVVGTVKSDPLAARSDAIACSDRCVYRISIDSDEQQMWVYRPRDGLVRLNLATNGIEQIIPLPNAGLSAVAHSRNESTTLMGGTHGAAILVDHRSDGGPLIAQVTHPGDMIIDAVVSDDGSIALCTTLQGQVHGWRREGSGWTEFAYRLPSGAPIARMDVTASGHRAFIGRFNGAVSFFDPVSGTPAGIEFKIDIEPGIECPLYALSENEKLLAAASTGGRIHIVDVSTGSQIDRTVRRCGLYSRSTSLAFSADAKYLAVSTNVSPIIEVWDVATGTRAGELTGHHGIVRTLQFASNDRLYSAGYDGSIREWSLVTWTNSRVVD